MARPISETPILYGEDARRFEEEIKANENKKCSKEEWDRLQESKKKFRIIK